MIGLLEVVCNYVIDCLVSFEMYVGICICGVMFDEFWCIDWMLCLVYCKVCEVVEVVC